MKSKTVLLLLLFFMQSNKATGSSISLNIIEVDTLIYDEDQLDTQPLFGECEDYKKLSNEKGCSYKALTSFIEEYFKYPQDDIEGEIEGVLAFEFVIEKTGKISQLNFTNEIGYGYEEQISKLFKEAIEFESGKVYGNDVRTKASLEIEFKYGYRPFEKVYSILEEMPLFGYCSELENKDAIKKCMREETYEYFFNEIEYPQEARDNGVKGTAVVRLLIDENGDVIAVDLQKGLGYGCDEEVIRAAEKMVPWTPGKHKGRKVKCYYNLPVMFLEY